MERRSQQSLGTKRDHGTKWSNETKLLNDIMERTNERTHARTNERTTDWTNQRTNHTMKQDKSMELKLVQFMDLLSITTDEKYATKESARTRAQNKHFVIFHTWDRTDPHFLTHWFLLSSRSGSRLPRVICIYTALAHVFACGVGTTVPTIRQTKWSVLMSWNRLARAAARTDVKTTTQNASLH